MSDYITKTIIVKGSADYLFDLWTNFETFPFFMKNIKEVVKTGPQTSHWVMEGPFGKNLEWEAEITDIIENKRIAWHSTEGDIKTSGAVTFNELYHGETEISVMLHYVPPAGRLGDAVAHAFDNPAKKLYDDLRGFKKHAEQETAVRL